VLEEVVITGTRRVDRSATDSASPVDVIQGSDISAQPSANMLETVKNLVPSFFVGQNTISDASTFVRAPSLRGLPSDQVLVMLNGKRFNRSALVQVYNGGDTGLSFGSHGSDISSIPSIAIKRLEVLRDGATAQYGSDAIAGVLNYGLRDDTGFEVLARYGQYKEDSDGESQQIAANFGAMLGDRGFVNLSASTTMTADEPRRHPSDSLGLCAGESQPGEQAAALPVAGADLGQFAEPWLQVPAQLGAGRDRGQQGLPVWQLCGKPRGSELQLPLLAGGHPDIRGRGWQRRPVGRP
jgi:iron complex outermembrane receptor protein